MSLKCARYYALAAVAAVLVLSREAHGRTDPKPNNEGGGCSVPASESQRVRREVRSLSPEQWTNVVDAMWTMKTTSDEEGKALYGDTFRSYDSFVLQHALAALDSRGDQGHYSAAFVTFHSALVLAFERSLLAINPSIEALPYWDSSIVEPSIYTEELFGSPIGTGDRNAVVDGKFGNWPVLANFSTISTSNYLALTGGHGWTNYTGNADGFLRHPNSTNTSPVFVRYGPGFEMNASDATVCHELGGLLLDWYNCIELGINSNNTVVTSNGGFPGDFPASSQHSGPHVMIGGMEGTSEGDFKDVATSPNDPLFMFHHANMDRSKMHWMHWNSAIADQYYGFPEENSTAVGPKAYEGTFYGINLFDVISDGWGFTAGDLGLSHMDPSSYQPDEMMTNADVLCYLSPAASPYIYDSMEGWLDGPAGGGGSVTLLDNSSCLPQVHRLGTAGLLALSMAALIGGALLA